MNKNSNNSNNMKCIKQYLTEQDILNKMTKNQLRFFNSICEEINSTYDKERKEWKENILDKLVEDYQQYMKKKNR